MSDLKRASSSESSNGSLGESRVEGETTKPVLSDYDPQEVERIWKKVDWHIMPVAILLYLASYIDRYVTRHLPKTVSSSRYIRANIGNAKVLGLTKSIHLTNNQYNLALSIFFVGYVLYETPSNILLKKFSPRWYIPIMTVCIRIPCIKLSTDSESV